MTDELEIDVESDIMRWCEEHRIMCYQLELRSGRGWSDLLATRDGITIVLIEVKKPGGGKVSPQQEFYRKILNVLVTDSFSEAIEHIEDRLGI